MRHSWIGWGHRPHRSGRDQRPALVHRGRVARHSGAGKPRASPGRRQERRTVVPSPASHRQPGTGLAAQRRPRLRLAHRSGCAGRLRSGAGGRAGGLDGRGRALAGWERAPRARRLADGRSGEARSHPAHVRARRRLARGGARAGCRSHPNRGPGPIGRASERAAHHPRAAHRARVDRGGPAAADRLLRGARAGACQARAGGGRGRRAQRAHGRAARGGQDAAGTRAAFDSAAPDARRGPGCDPRLLGGRHAAGRNAAAHPAAVPRSAPHHLACRAGGRRQLAAPRGDLACPSRRALPGRVAGVRHARPGGAAPAAGGQGGDHLAGARHTDLPGQLHAGGGDEPVPVRLRGRSGARLHLRTLLDHALPEAHLRAPARPHRYPRRGAAGGVRQTDRSAPGGVLRHHS